MGEVFLISDTHFGHRNVLKFEYEGKPLRPFKSLTEMHVTIVERWNSVVQPQDKVYHLGDVAFTRDSLALLAMCNGRKRLIRGNHDLIKLHEYRKYFQEIYGVRAIDGYWFTHVPMHDVSTSEPRVKGNVHGHLHAKPAPTSKHFNVCVEQIDYTPISFDVVRDALRTQQETTNDPN